jgi:GNAT superfamily N-acetyltransferase
LQTATPGNLYVRQALSTDAAAACDVLRPSIVQLCSADHGNDATIMERWLANKTLERVATWFTAIDSFSAVVLSGLSMAGWVMLHRRGEIQLCYVAPEHIGCGAGRMLVTAVEEQGRDWSLAQIYLSSTATARQFYARLGYSAAREPEESFGLRAFPMMKSLITS